MKKIFVLLMVMMLLLVPLSASAEDSTEATTAPAEEELDWGAVSKNIEHWFYENYDKALVTAFLLVSAFAEKSREKRINKSMGTINNNAITVAEKSSAFMAEALGNIKNTAGVVTSYDERILAMLEEFKMAAEDRAMLEKELVETKNYLRTATDANLEFANELADLLALANIPNFKKEELGARHLKSVNAIIEAEGKAEAAAEAAAKLLLPAEEVSENDSEAEKE